MGEAKRRRQAQITTVYHHTSTLRTNLIWMSGVIELEGRGQDALHPQLGTVKSDSLLRRAMIDFPPLAWFTSKIEIPRCLLGAQLFFVDKAGNKIEGPAGGEFANGLALNRMALGFMVSDIPVRRWVDHPGHDTDEGRELNRTALGKV